MRNMIPIPVALVFCGCQLQPARCQRHRSPNFRHLGFWSSEHEAAGQYRLRMTNRDLDRVGAPDLELWFRGSGGRFLRFIA